MLYPGEGGRVCTPCTLPLDLSAKSRIKRDCKNEDEYDSELYLIMDTVVMCVVD